MSISSNEIWPRIQLGRQEQKRLAPFAKRIEIHSLDGVEERYPRRDELWAGEKCARAGFPKPIESKIHRSENAEASWTLHTILFRAA
jgi:hypothetical protein